MVDFPLRNNREGGPKKLYELGYSVGKPEDNDVQAVLGSWQPEEYVELPGINEKLPDADDAFGVPGTKSGLAEAVDNKHGDLPRQFELPKATPKKDMPRTQDGHMPGEARKHVAGNVITNVSEDTEPTKLDLESDNYVVPQDYNDPPEHLHGYERLELVTGPIPYAHIPEFREGVFVRPLNPIDAARISRAVKSKSLTALLDALSHTVNIPYRYLAIADHEQIMYWHMLNSYPIEPFNVTWHSMYTRDPIVTAVRQPIVKENKLRITESQFREAREKGLDIPRVMSLDIGDTVSAMPVDVPGIHSDPVKEKAAQDARDYKDDLMYLLYYMQWIDVNNKDVRAKIREEYKKESVQPRLRGLMAYLADKKNLSIFTDVDAFSKLFENYGMAETFKAAAAEEMLIIPALRALNDYMLAFPNSSKPVMSEIERLENILASKPEDERETATFKPVKEETTNRCSPWAFFSFVQ